MVAVEVSCCITAVNNEELRSTCVAPGVRHRKDAEVVELIVAVQFAIDAVPRAAAADALRATTLGNESWNDPVKFQAVVEAVLCEFDEVRDRIGCVVFKEFHGHCTAVGGDFCVHGESIAVNEKASRSGRLFVERETRLELATPTLARLCSTN